MPSTSFSPTSFPSTFSPDHHIPTPENNKTFSQCIKEAFNIPTNDTYTYLAQGETTLTTTQKAINGKRAHNLHNWYHDASGNPIEFPTSPSPASGSPFPPPSEITAYTTLFAPSLSLPKALNAFHASSKPHTLRAQVSTHLTSRYLNTTTGLLPPRKDHKHTNPYLDYWTYTCHELEWCGPWPNTLYTKQSHHILPILYHHFGCVVPSYAALHVIAKLVQPARPSKEAVRPILDVGSGSGYWTFMLRNFPLGEGMKGLDVRAVDNGTSEYRIMWVEDTIKMDGVSYLSQHGNGRGCVLLLVYPQATGDFTAPLLRKFEGDSVVVAGTQNGNGFTAFRDCVVDEWVEKNLRAFELTLRMPLPSFAGKDEALFVFQRKKT
ncbi:hypothetical protein CC80DRAFT_476148 [Byssothecium circinans]|uniref:Methyltransferase domain-containing protein n=1 Tax=Byssothecium circinans TaxID=147558 RepID=A0A6A5TRR6_9PLEO|nr:hypothetical protein CC80DRAFT_476148 [Byssothecium circinans]